MIRQVDGADDLDFDLDLNDDTNEGEEEVAELLLRSRQSSP